MLCCVVWLCVVVCCVVLLCFVLFCCVVVLCRVVVFCRSCLGSIFGRFGGVLVRFFVILEGLGGSLGGSWALLGAS